ncbi:uncharacterized protein LOC110605572 [Manihot esculenta]|uniref:uncharacterized protein LOC110605572 n=1 Tax=Manihot esculenta TaxID=3983 RepID=UPI001CC4621B|nr:uncharacterized protein LOC110605572 [Manihot esculenta]XP_043808287.1 uncharacterized protein LOC110605572 [Manihot esculenta]
MLWSLFLKRACPFIGSHYANYVVLLLRSKQRAHQFRLSKVVPMQFLMKKMINCTPISYAYFVNNFHKVYFCGYRCPDHFINILNLVYFYISLSIYWEPLCQLCSTFVEEQAEGTSVQAEQSGSHAVSDEENDQFWCLDDVPVEANNSLDDSTSKDASFYRFVKPPANLVVLEGDCLDTSGDGGELESYLV